MDALILIKTGAAAAHKDPAGMPARLAPALPAGLRLQFRKREVHLRVAHDGMRTCAGMWPGSDTAGMCRQHRGEICFDSMTRCYCVGMCGDSQQAVPVHLRPKVAADELRSQPRSAVPGMHRISYQC